MTTVDVVVAGGGPAGLTMAALLGRFGLSVVLLERRAEVNPHPRARSVNVRTGEILQQLGVLDAIRDVSLPPEWSSQLVYTESLAGREIGRTAMSVQPIVDGEVHSFAPWLLSSQDQIEPVLRELVESTAHIDARWGSEVLGLDETEAGVLTLFTNADGVTEQIESRWLIAADGAASRVRRQLGIEMEGPTDLATLVNCHFYADLGPWTDDRPATLYWTTHPARNVFQKIDTQNRWLCQIGYDPRVNSPGDFDRDTAADWIRRSVGVDDVDVNVIDVIPWTMSCTVAERMRSGPVFLIGDAAHQLPPSGGFGMNTAVQDAHNLAWKLAWVSRGLAGEALLDTYDEERRPIARYNADQSLENGRNVGRIRKLVERGGSDEASEREAIEASGRYGNWLGMDIGLAYEHGCLVPDGSEPPPVADVVSDYAPTGRPGHRAPHAEVVVDGATISTLDLFDEDFVLFLGEQTESGPMGEPGVRQFVVSRDLMDADERLVSRYGLAPEGVVLVRPDGHIAWRGDDAAQIPQLLTELLHR